MPEQHPHLVSLKERHRALDDQIGEIEKRPYVDATEIKSLKRKKLYLKEEMAAFE
jgi:hypothetical protein